MAKQQKAREDDWWGAFHLHAFLRLTCADTEVERRELVWIKRFFLRHNRPQLYERLRQSVACGEQRNPERLIELTTVAAERMTSGEKRRFVYNLAQMCKAKGGALRAVEYEDILDIAEEIGIDDTDADNIINTVFSINETFMAIIGLLAIGVILYATQGVIVPLIIALFITMVINRVAGLLGRVVRSARLRWITKIGAMVVIMSGLFALVTATAVAGKEVLNRRDYYEQRIEESLTTLQTTANSYGITWLDRSGIVEQLQKLPIGSAVSSFVGSLINLTGNFFLVLLFTGFLVFASSDTYTGILQEMNEKISGYISVKTVTSLLTGIVVLGLCKLFAVDFALFWAILAFLLNFIPSVGAIIASIPPILLALITLRLSSVLLFGTLLTTAHVTIGQVLEPKMMGSRLAVKPLAILLGLIFWGFLWGIPGMFLAAPLMALLRILASHFNFSRTFERLLAAD